jgi:hypothetical protein
MAMCRAFQMDGGPHHGACLDPSVSGPHEETLFLISFDDGAAYARAGEQVRDAAGQLRELFRFDADGSLTEHAKRRFTTLP